MELFNTVFCKLVLSESVLSRGSRVRIQSLYPQSKSSIEGPFSNIPHYRRLLSVWNRYPAKGKETETCLTKYDYLTDRNPLGTKWRMYIHCVNLTMFSNLCDFFFPFHWIWAASTNGVFKRKAMFAFTFT